MLHWKEQEKNLQVIKYLIKMTYLLHIQADFIEGLYILLC